MTDWRRLLAQVERASEIATVLWASGFGWVVAALGLRSCVSVGCRAVCATRLRQCEHHVDMAQPLPDRMRLVVERLGPTFVKVGQVLALRPDYVPLEYAHALRQLHDHVSPFPPAEARRVVERELDMPLAGAFADFEGEPFAAASLSQVHRAVLPDGSPVAVKVQRPRIAEQMHNDLDLLAFLAHRLEHRRPEAMGFRPSAAVDRTAAGGLVPTAIPRLGYHRGHSAACGVRGHHPAAAAGSVARSRDTFRPDVAT